MVSVPSLEYMEGRYRVLPGTNIMGGMPQRHMAADTIGGIVDAVSDQIPVKRILVGIDAFHTMTGHFFPVLMTAGA